MSIRKVTSRTIINDIKSHLLNSLMSAMNDILPKDDGLVQWGIWYGTNDGLNRPLRIHWPNAYGELPIEDMREIVSMYGNWDLMHTGVNGLAETFVIYETSS